jgi:hypothetical protein
VITVQHSMHEAGLDKRSWPAARVSRSEKDAWFREAFLAIAKSVRFGAGNGGRNVQMATPF